MRNRFSKSSHISESSRTSPIYFGGRQLKIVEQREGLSLQLGKTEIDITNEDAQEFEKQRSVFLKLSQSSRQRRRLIDELRFKDPKRRVLIDASTLNNAIFCIGEFAGKPSPAALMDLSSFAFALIFYDEIITLPSKWRKLWSADKRLDGVLHTLKFERQTIVKDLWDFCTQDSDFLENHDLKKKIEEDYEVMMGFPNNFINLDFREYDYYQDSPGFKGAIPPFWNGSVASYYIKESFGSSTSENIEELNKYLSISCVRTAFLDQVASHLHVPYICSSLRAPVHWCLLSEKVRFQQIADRLLFRLSQADNKIEHVAPYIAEFSAPYLLGIAMNNAKNPQEVFENLLVLREKCNPIRKELANSMSDWDGRENDYLQQKFGRCFDSNGSSELTPSSQNTSASFIFAFNLHSLGLVPTLQAGLKLDRASRSLGLTKRYLMKWYKPELYAAFSLKDEALALRSIHNRVKAIWNVDWGRGELDFLERLSVSQPLQSNYLPRL